MDRLDTKEALFDFLRGFHPRHLIEFKALEMLLYDISDEQYKKTLFDAEVMLTLES